VEDLDLGAESAAQKNPLLTSNDQTWLTPEPVLARVRNVGPIGLDPCGNRNAIVRARTEWYGEGSDDDGLIQDWLMRPDGARLRPGEVLFCNPPYQTIKTWAARAATFGKQMMDESWGSALILLVAARTDTQWFDAVWGAPVKCFVRGRLKFGGGNGATNSATFPSALACWGPADLRARFVAAFLSLGEIVGNRDRQLTDGGHVVLPPARRVESADLDL
jgi:hypothetical protein